MPFLKKRINRGFRTVRLRRVSLEFTQSPLPKITLVLLQNCSVLPSFSEGGVPERFNQSIRMIWPSSTVIFILLYFVPYRAQASIIFCFSFSYSLFGDALIRLLMGMHQSETSRRVVAVDEHKFKFERHEGLHL